MPRAGQRLDQLIDLQQDGVGVRGWDWPIDQDHALVSIGHWINAAEAGLNTEYGARLGAELLALKDVPDDALLDRVQAIGVTAARSILDDEAKRPRYTDRPAKMDCIALMNRINELIRIGPHDHHPARDAPYRS